MKYRIIGIFFAAIAVIPIVLATPAEKLVPGEKKPATGDKERKGPSGVSPEKEKKIRKLFDVSGTDRMILFSIENVAKDLAREADAPKGVSGKFLELAKPDRLRDKLIGVYAKYLEEPQIDAAIAFYQSAEGMKFARARPGIEMEGNLATKIWTTELTLMAIAEVSGINGGEKTQR